MGYYRTGEAEYEKEIEMTEEPMDAEYEDESREVAVPQRGELAHAEPRAQLPVPLKQAMEMPAVYRGAGMTPITEEESKELLADFDDEDFEIRAHDGQVYLGNAAQRRRFNQVFGPGQWALVPHGDMVIEEKKTRRGEAMKEISREFGLYVRGHFVAAAWGSCDYIPSNDQMSHADAVEGARSDAFKKCAKDLGLASNQAFNPIWREDWKNRCCKNVGGKWKTIWALGAPVGGSEQPRERAQAASKPVSRPQAAQGAPRRDPVPEMPLESPGMPPGGPGEAFDRVPDGVKVGDHNDGESKMGYVLEVYAPKTTKKDGSPLVDKSGKAFEIWDMKLQSAEKDKEPFPASIMSFKSERAYDTAVWAKRHGLPVLFKAEWNEKFKKADLSFLALEPHALDNAIMEHANPSGPETKESDNPEADEFPL